MKKSVICLLLAGSCLLAKPKPSKVPWPTGKITDAGSSRTRSTLRFDEVVIEADDFIYTVSDDKVDNTAVGGPATVALGAWIAHSKNHSHGCRFIVGDPVQYLPNKDKMQVIDADGKECHMEIVRQERVQEK